MPIFEPEFLGFSYGFRPGRGAHDALDALAYGIERRKVNWIVDADVKAFFDRLDRSWLIRFVEHRIGDRRVIRLISKWLGAGVMEEGEWWDTLRGTPQGSSVSPILANIYLHFVLDLWFQRKWRARIARGETIIVRYADDFVVGFQYKRDAERFLCDLKDRLAAFSLELHPDKTRLIEFGRFAMANRRARGRAASRDLRLPRVHALLPDHAEGTFRTGAQADQEACHPTLKRIEAELRQRMHDNIYEVAIWLGRVVGGWLRYYAVPTSSRSLQTFGHRLKRLWLRVLRRRSQKDRLPWGKVDLLAAVFWPPLRTVHPWPDRRFAGNHPR